MMIGQRLIPVSVNERLLLMGHRLTPLQIEYLRFIIVYAIDHNGNSPTQAEVAANFGVVWNTARGHLEELSNKRLIQLNDSKIVVENAVWEPPQNIVE